MKYLIHERVLDDGFVEQRLKSSDAPQALGSEPKNPADWRVVADEMRSQGWHGPRVLLFDGQHAKGFVRLLRVTSPGGKQMPECA
jgi:hypothetical protein